jgi:hypothetical protein
MLISDRQTYGQTYQNYSSEPHNNIIFLIAYKLLKFHTKVL